VVHGDDDRCQPLARAQRLAELTGAPLVVLEGAGHLPTARHSVKVNLLIRDFVDQLTGRR
jgi:pimeloyl-ACP methyl ester carboxylesterase